MYSKITFLVTHLALMLSSITSLYADQSTDSTLSKIKECFFNDSEYVILSKSKNKKQSITTSVFAYQYTTDGYLQLVSVYSDSVICTNLEGPRQGAQFIIMNNGALVDMCNFYTEHSDYVVHKYTWGDVKTYIDHQTVTLK